MELANAYTLLDEAVRDAHRIQNEFFEDCSVLLSLAAKTIARRIQDGGSIVLFGNGGSAADAQHIAAEFVGRFGPDRAAISALSLSSDPSVVTAIGNDYGFDQIFARQIEAHCGVGDVAIGISTSGTSKNVLAGIKTARKLGLYPVLFTGNKRSPADTPVQFCVPSDKTPRIQETHIMLGHLLAELVDRELYPDAWRS